MKDGVRLTYLDGLRGVAACVVVIFHYFNIFYPVLTLRDVHAVHLSDNIEIILGSTPISILFNGDFAVCIFFVLSGYALSFNYFRKNDRAGLISHAFKRYFRLAPLVVFSVLVSYICIHALPSQPMFQNQTAYSLSRALYEGFIGSLLYGKATFNPVLWAMKYIFYGSYLVIGFCAMFGSNGYGRLYGYITALFVFWTTPYYLAFIIGLLLSDLTNSKTNVVGKYNNRIINIILFLLAIYFGSYPTNSALLGPDGGSISIRTTMYSLLNYFNKDLSFWHVVGATLFILVTIRSTVLKSFLSLRSVQFLGKISFPDYVVHLFVFYFFSHYLINLLILKYSISYNIGAGVTFLVSIPLIIIISYLAEKYIDAPGVRLASYVYNRIFAGKDRFQV